jgi:hypothetical protein
MEAPSRGAVDQIDGPVTTVVISGLGEKGGDYLRSDTLGSITTRVWRDTWAAAGPRCSPTKVGTGAVVVLMAATAYPSV